MIVIIHPFFLSLMSYSSAFVVGLYIFFFFFNLMLLISFRLFMQARKHGMGHDMEEEETTTEHVSIPQAHTCIDSLSFAKGFKQLFVPLKCSSVLLLS